jgi:hypothetical protein
MYIIIYIHTKIFNKKKSQIKLLFKHFEILILRVNRKLKFKIMFYLKKIISIIAISYIAMDYLYRKYV